MSEGVSAARGASAAVRDRGAGDDGVAGLAPSRFSRRPAALALLALAACARGPAPDLPPSVAVLLVDTLRADRLHAYGHGRATSPAIDALAAEGVLFEEASAPAPWTLPSVVSLMTGRHVPEHGVVRDGLVLSESLETLAERFRRLGYATASFHQNPYAGELSGLDRGFDLVVRTELQTEGEDLAEWLDGVRERPFFLYVHNTEPHDPGFAADAFVQRFGEVPMEQRREVKRRTARYRSLTRVDHEAGRPPGTTDNTQEQEAAMAELAALAPAIDVLYDAAVAEADHRMGTIVDALRRAGRFDDCLIVFLADHGEELGDHGGWQHDQSLHRELVHVPLVLRLPGGEAGGTRVAAPVSLVDVLPTLLDFVGELPPDGTSGRSLLPLVRGAADDPGPRVTAVRVNRKKYFRPWAELRGDTNVAVRDGRWKLLYSPDVGRAELYDLASDPREETDVAALHPERAAELRAFAERRLSELARSGAEARERGEELDDATREALQRLGYVDGR